VHTQAKRLRNLKIALIRAVGAMNKQALSGSFVIVLVLAAPLAGRAVGTVWGAISAYQTAMVVFHDRQIALDITGQVVKAAYRTYVYGR
jgi:uncharacterized membrane protein